MKFHFRVNSNWGKLKKKIMFKFTIFPIGMSIHSTQRHKPYIYPHSYKILPYIVTKTCKIREKNEIEIERKGATSTKTMHQQRNAFSNLKLFAFGAISRREQKNDPEKRKNQWESQWKWKVKSGKVENTWSFISFLFTKLDQLHSQVQD